MNLHPCLQQRGGVVFRCRDTFTWIYTPASSSTAVLCLGVATRLHESTPLPPAARRVVFRCRDTFTWIYTPASSSTAVLCLGVATRLHESTPLPPAARRVVFRCRDTFTWIYTPASSSAAVLECSKTVYHCSASSNLFMPPNEERKRTSFEVYQGLKEPIF